MEPVMYCVECRETGRSPWEHRPDCVEGLRQKLRLYEIAFGLMLVVVIVEIAFIAVAFVRAGACS